MLTVNQAHEWIASQVQLLPAQRVTLEKSRHRVLSEDIVTSEDLPGFDRSAVDGYAFRATGGAQRLRVMGNVPAGTCSEYEISTGECVQIATGAALPKGADTVAMREVIRREGDCVLVPEISCGSGVRKRGEDAKAGEILLASGHSIGAPEAALMAQIGHSLPLVAAVPRIFHLVTGSELVSPEQHPQLGQIRDSNTTLMAALAEEARAEIVVWKRVGDDFAELVKTLRDPLAGSWDLLLISGGASGGDYDFGAKALSEIGFSIHFEKVRIKPGKPLIFATRGRQVAFVIPGNPLSHLVCWHVFIRRALEKMGRARMNWELCDVLLSGEMAITAEAREVWWPARIFYLESRIHAMPLPWKSSGDMTRLGGVNALLRVPVDCGKIFPGSLTQALLF